MSKINRAKFLRLSFAKQLEEVGYLLHGSNRFVKAEKDLIKGFLFDWSGGDVYVHWFIMPVFSPTGVFYLNYGDRLSAGKPFNRRFPMDQMSVRSSTEVILQLIFDQVPELERIDSVLEFENSFFKDEWKSDERWIETLVYVKNYTLQADRLDIIERAVDALDAGGRLDLGWVKEIKSNILILKEANGRSISAVNEVFDTWKRETIANLRLEKFIVN